MLCAYAIQEEREQELKEMGVKDSKLLSAKERERLYAKLVKMGDFEVRQLSAEEITSLMRKRVNLNDIEAKEAGLALEAIHSRSKISKAFIDSPDPIPEKFEKRIRKYVDAHFNLVCENKADYNYPVVGAASIIAKVIRDEEIEKIKREVGFDFGTGYSHDVNTIEFLKKNWKRQEVSKYIRHTWQTAKDLKNVQVDLSKFL